MPPTPNLTSNSTLNVRPRAQAATYDLIVIGAGGIGSATAYHAARAGLRVLLLEQFTVGHTRGSSHGGSRIIRYTHDAVEDAAQMPATFPLWRELEAASGARLLQMTGGLYLGPDDEPWLANARHATETLGFAHRILRGAELAHAYPQFSVPAGWYALEQADSGILAASYAVAVMVSQAVRHGATVRELAPVAGVAPETDGVVVRLANGETFAGKRVVIAAGPWASHFLGRLVDREIPLRVTHQQVAYFAPHEPNAFAVGAFPLFITTRDPHFYGFPIFERRGLIKVALEQSATTVDPDAPRALDDGFTAQMIDHLREFLPAVEPTPVLVEPCLYTETPTRDFIIDRHPEHPQMLIAAGFSGRGFKHTIAIGQLLTTLAQSDPGHYASPFWRESYRLTRFAASPAAAQSLAPTQSA
jgi:sarcosine oxidase